MKLTFYMLLHVPFVHPYRYYLSDMYKGRCAAYASREDTAIFGVPPYIIRLGGDYQPSFEIPRANEYPVYPTTTVITGPREAASRH